MKSLFSVIFDGDYISGYQVVSAGGNATNADIEKINAALANAPDCPCGLRRDLTWELHKPPVSEESEEITNEEAYNIIMGVE